MSFDKHIPTKMKSISIIPERFIFCAPSQSIPPPYGQQLSTITVINSHFLKFYINELTNPVLFYYLQCEISFT